MSKHMRRNICLKAFVVGIVEQICEDNDIHHERFENNLKTGEI
jgi:hypothetical protein